MGAAELDKENPLVSISCLTFNHEKYIRQALDGFLMQEVSFPYEILIHDDASTDGTAAIIREYAAAQPDIIRPLIQTENQYSKGITHASGAYNFPRARGKYIAMCEGDDYWTDPHKLQRQVDYMQSHPECSICFHSAAVMAVDGSLAGSRVRPYKDSRIISPEEIIDKKSGYPTASLLFRREVVEQIPEYYVNCPVGDIPLQLMAAAKGYGYYLDLPMCVYRVGVSGSWTSQMMSGDYEKKQILYEQRMRKTYESFDRETVGQFHEAAQRAADRIGFLTLVNTKRYDQVLLPRYRSFYRELDLRTRFFIRLEEAAPWFYRFLQRAVKSVRGEG